MGIARPPTPAIQLAPRDATSRMVRGGSIQVRAPQGSHRTVLFCDFDQPSRWNRRNAYSDSGAARVHHGALSRATRHWLIRPVALLLYARKMPMLLAGNPAVALLRKGRSSGGEQRLRTCPAVALQNPSSGLRRLFRAWPSRLPMPQRPAPEAAPWAPFSNECVQKWATETPPDLNMPVGARR